MPADPNPKLALLRYSGDLSTKARGTRYRFVRRLLHNLRDAAVAEGIAPRIDISHDRILVSLHERADLAPLTRVFGLQSVSLVERRPATGIDAIVADGLELFAARVRSRRFAVRARRVGNRPADAVGTREVERRLGAALLPHAAGVDLENPEVTVHLEITRDATFYFTERIPAPGGLPLGVSGRAVALLSGGFDSAVAAWQMLKRGISLDYVFCNLGGATHEQGALRVAKVLADRWSYGEKPRFHAVDFAPIAGDLMERAQTRYWQVLLKRSMLRVAARVARERRAAAIVTGEAVGQVSSQTLPNLSVISASTELPILRPLVGFNKEEIIALARRVGTFELSKVVGEYCALVPRRPATAAKAEVIGAEEAALDAGLVEHALAARRVIDLRDLDLEKLELPELEIASVPEGATMIDLRPKAAFDAWHFPGAVRLDFAQALQAHASFDRSRTYVVYCPIGLKSAHVAEVMRRHGLDAHRFRGDLRAMRHHAEMR